MSRRRDPNKPLPMTKTTITPETDRKGRPIRKRGELTFSTKKARFVVKFDYQPTFSTTVERMHHKHGAPKNYPTRTGSGSTLRVTIGKMQRGRWTTIRSKTFIGTLADGWFASLWDAAMPGRDVWVVWDLVKPRTGHMWTMERTGEDTTHEYRVTENNDPTRRVPFSEKSTFQDGQRSAKWNTPHVDDKSPKAEAWRRGEM